MVLQVQEVPHLTWPACCRLPFYFTKCLCPYIILFSRPASSLHSRCSRATLSLWSSSGGRWEVETIHDLIFFKFKIICCRRWRSLPPSPWQPSPVTSWCSLACVCPNEFYVAPLWFLDSPRKIALLCHCFPQTLMKYIPARTSCSSKVHSLGNW